MSGRSVRHVQVPWSEKPLLFVDSVATAVSVSQDEGVSRGRVYTPEELDALRGLDKQHAQAVGLAKQLFDAVITGRSKDEGGNAWPQDSRERARALAESTRDSSRRSPKRKKR